MNVTIRIRSQDKTTTLYLTLEEQEAERKQQQIVDVPSSSRPGMLHRVVLEDNQPKCDCESFTYRGTCKHVNYAINLLGCGNPGERAAKRPAPEKIEIEVNG